MVPLLRQVRSFLIFSVGAHQSPPRPALIPGGRTARTPKHPASQAANSPTRGPRRKRGLCRRFLVSLGVRRRQSPTSQFGTKESRHDPILLGGSGCCSSCSCPAFSLPCSNHPRYCPCS